MNGCSAAQGLRNEFTNHPKRNKYSEEDILESAIKTIANANNIHSKILF